MARHCQDINAERTAERHVGNRRAAAGGWRQATRQRTGGGGAVAPGTGFGGCHRSPHLEAAEHEVGSLPSM